MKKIFFFFFICHVCLLDVDRLADEWFVWSTRRWALYPGCFWWAWEGTEPRFASQNQVYLCEKRQGIKIFILEFNG
jgi:hypothetical protein